MTKGVPCFQKKYLDINCICGFSLYHNKMYEFVNIVPRIWPRNPAHLLGIPFKIPHRMSLGRPDIKKRWTFVQTPQQWKWYLHAIISGRNRESGLIKKILPGKADKFAWASILNSLNGRFNWTRNSVYFWRVHEEYRVLCVMRGIRG